MEKYTLRIEVDFDFDITTDISCELLDMDFSGQNGDARVEYKDMITYAVIEVEALSEDDIEGNEDIDIETLIETYLENEIQANHIDRININSWTIDEIYES